jgi:hypothetical protein
VEKISGTPATMSRWGFEKAEHKPYLLVRSNFGQKRQNIGEMVCKSEAQAEGFVLKIRVEDAEHTLVANTFSKRREE